jgi:serine/threonine protein kinase
MVRPLLDGLEKVHAAGFLHRDIKPDNIFLREDGGPVLIDFGSARQTAGESGQALTTILTPGYAPFEQYTTSKLQGPWSDIYSLGAVLFFVVTGKSPPDAITRMKNDTLREQLAPALEHYSPGLIEAIGWSLALEESGRPRDVAMWRDALLSATDADRNATPASVGVRAVRVEPYVPTDVLQTEAVIVATMPLPETLPTTVRFLSAMQTRHVARGAAGAGIGCWPIFCSWRSAPR